MINVIYLQQAYKRREITEVKWINSNINLVDAITKSKPCLALTQLININIVQLKAIGWVKQTDTNP
jgi:hypothetical protein